MQRFKKTTNSWGTERELRGNWSRSTESTNWRFGAKRPTRIPIYTPQVIDSALFLQYPWCRVISFCERSYSGGSSITLPYCAIERLNYPASILTLLFKSLRVLVACRTCIVLRVERGAESSRINSLTHFQHITSLLQICDWAIRVSLVLVYCIAASLAHWLPRWIFFFFWRRQSREVFSAPEMVGFNFGRSFGTTPLSWPRIPFAFLPLRLTTKINECVFRKGEAKVGCWC